MEIFDPIITDLNLLSFSGWLQKIPGLHTKSGQQCNTQQIVRWTRPEVPNLGQSGTILHQGGNNLNITLERFTSDSFCNFFFEIDQFHLFQIPNFPCSTYTLKRGAVTGNLYIHESQFINCFTSTYTFMRINWRHEHCMEGWLNSELKKTF